MYAPSRPHGLLCRLIKSQLRIFNREPAHRVLVVFVQERRISRSQFWMDLFGDLRDSGNFNGSHEHQSLLKILLHWSSADGLG
ncbi:hypothetical protein FQA47_017267 [Oryzias melastigma]|uniref:Uncharacterized protein n=1 Tax=Oryzias melastigma TaxID=30732 RepID=A0A834FL97_ORYME|nr:hypothetical protein FQA47_017267 [Oryzias melastigma]